MIQQRRARLEADRHARDIDLDHQIVWKIRVRVRPVGAGHEVRRFIEVLVEQIERRPAEMRHGRAIRSRFWASVKETIELAQRWLHFTALAEPLGE